MKTSTFEFPHERDPLFLAATKFYALVTKIDPQPGSVAMRRRLESAAAQIFLSIQEAIDFSDLRTKRWGSRSGVAPEQPES